MPRTVHLLSTMSTPFEYHYVLLTLTTNVIETLLDRQITVDRIDRTFPGFHSVECFDSVNLQFYDLGHEVDPSELFDEFLEKKPERGARWNRVTLSDKEFRKRLKTYDESQSDLADSIVCVHYAKGGFYWALTVYEDEGPRVVETPEILWSELQAHYDGRKKIWLEE